VGVGGPVFGCINLFHATQVSVLSFLEEATLIRERHKRRRQILDRLDKPEVQYQRGRCESRSIELGGGPSFAQGSLRMKANETRVLEVLAAALKLTTQRELDDFLRTACEGDQELLEKVLALLAAYNRPSSAPPQQT
jgi:hypothetical protein